MNGRAVERRPNFHNGHAARRQPLMRQKLQSEIPPPRLINMLHQLLLTLKRVSLFVEAQSRELLFCFDFVKMIENAYRFAVGRVAEGGGQTVVKGVFEVTPLQIFGLI